MFRRLPVLCIWLVFILTASVVPVHGTSDLALQKREWRKKGDVVWALWPQEKVIALTFDDGPNPEYTRAVLDLLKAHDAKATFFVIGSRVEKYPLIVKEIAGGGHQIGLHGFAHRNMAVWPERKVDDDFHKAEESLRNIGLQAHVFRPPLGEISSTLVDVARRRGHTVVMWSWTQDTRDWTRPKPATIAASVLRDVRPGDIVLLHDGTGNRKNTVAAVKLILEGLQQQGFKGVTIDQLLGLPQVPWERRLPRRGP